MARIALTGVSLPHARGGVSRVAEPSAAMVRSSPRTWGCFSVVTIRFTPVSVFPTHVGVFPPLFRSDGSRAGLPHARGGVSGRAVTDAPDLRSSPRTWGCFHEGSHHQGTILVFPTHVGVFLLYPFADIADHGLPHACGGVSVNTYLLKEPITASNGTPHTFLWVLPAS